MTWFYVCKNCGKLVAHGKSGKIGIQKIEVFGECCYDLQEEVEEINKAREKRGLDKQELK